MNDFNKTTTADADGVIASPQPVSTTALAALTASEIDMQVATAHRFPRSIAQFRRDVGDMVTLSESIAQECIYALPRGGKVIEGPSARFAEVILSAWGNSRAGARVISDSGDYVTAQGAFHDLQRNVQITYEVQRRIVDKKGRRFDVDMIGVTANAACSIALRNAVLRGIPRAFWIEMYDAARKTAMGDVKTLPTRRAETFALLQGYGVTKEQAFAKLGVRGEADVGLDHLVTLRGIIMAIKDGETTPEAAFAEDVQQQQQSGDAGSSTQQQRPATPSASTPPPGDVRAKLRAAVGGMKSGAASAPPPPPAGEQEQRPVGVGKPPQFELDDDEGGAP